MQRILCLLSETTPFIMPVKQFCNIYITHSFDVKTFEKIFYVKTYFELQHYQFTGQGRYFQTMKYLMTYLIKNSVLYTLKEKMQS